MPPKNDMRTWQSIVVGVIIGFLAGVGTMQATLVSDVTSHGVKLANLDHRLDLTDALIEKRISNVILLWEKSLESNRALMESNRELISLVKQAIAVDNATWNNSSGPGGKGNRP